MRIASTTYGDVGELAELFVGEDWLGEGCCAMIRLAGGYSLNDLCFLLVAFPALCEKLSRYDLFLLEVNMLTLLAEFDMGVINERERPECE